jgi:hypothetical protein
VLPIYIFIYLFVFILFIYLFIYFISLYLVIYLFVKHVHDIEVVRGGVPVQNGAPPPTQPHPSANTQYIRETSPSISQEGIVPRRPNRI